MLGPPTLRFPSQKVTRPWKTILSGSAGGLSFFVPRPSRAFSRAICVSHAFCSTDKEKRETARSLWWWRENNWNMVVVVVVVVEGTWKIVLLVRVRVSNVIGVNVFLRFLTKERGLIRSLYHHFNSYWIIIHGISRWKIYLYKGTWKTDG